MSSLKLINIYSKNYYLFLFKKQVGNMNRNKRILVMLVFGLFWASSFAQDNVNKGVEFEPRVIPGHDTANADGWVALFDGTEASLTNFYLPWRHGGLGRWWVAPDPDTDSDQFWTPNASDSVLWSDQSSGGTGGILTTHRRYTDVEVKLWCKCGWGNDGGIFLRSNDDGYAWQVVIDYKNGSRIGELYDEGTQANADRIQTYSLRNNGTTIEPANRFPVPWLEMWDPDGYNLFWAKVTGRPVRIQSKINDIDIMDFQANNTGSRLADDGRLGIQIHNGESAWRGGPNKYTLFEIRELDENTGEPMNPIITTSPQSQGAPQGGSATFSYVSSATDVTIQWQKDGVDIPGANQPEYTIPSVTASDVGWYTVILEDNNNGRITRSDPAELGTVSILKPNAIQNIKVNWENSGSLEVRGFAESSQTLQIMSTNGKLLGEVAVKKGAFTEHFTLDNNGIYLITIKGDRSFAPIVVSQINH